MFTPLQQQKPTPVDLVLKVYLDVADRKLGSMVIGSMG